MRRPCLPVLFVDGWQCLLILWAVKELEMIPATRFLDLLPPCEKHTIFFRSCQPSLTAHLSYNLLLLALIFYITRRLSPGWVSQKELN